MLSLGEKEGIIKVVVQIPRGVYTDMEEHLAAKYHLKDVVIADCSVDRESPAMIREIGTCAASYVENILRVYQCLGRGDCIADGFLRMHRPQYADLHSERDESLQRDRPVGRFLLRRDTD